MTYTKPQIAGLPSALEAVQSDMFKIQPIIFDSRGFMQSNPAYETDE